MTQATPSIAPAPISTVHDRARPDSFLRILLDLSKVRIAWLVTLTSGVGFLMASLGRTHEALPFALSGIGALFGTALSAMGANALNQCWERDRDALMHRTCSRPLPAERIRMPGALAISLGLAAAGLLTLWLLCGPLPMLVSLATILIYVFIYTPLKPATTLNTLVGAIPGALPPLIGWCAAWPSPGTFAVDSAPLMLAGGWSLFLVIFVWQIPHFLAIAWMYKEDYERGGYRMLPAADPTGERTARTVLLWSIAFLPVSIAPAWLIPGRLGWAFIAITGTASIGLLWTAIGLSRSRSRQAARKVFFASIMHLPVFLLAMVGDAMIRVIW